MKTIYKTVTICGNSCRDHELSKWYSMWAKEIGFNQSKEKGNKTKYVLVV